MFLGQAHEAIPQASRSTNSRIYGTLVLDVLIGGHHGTTILLHYKMLITTTTHHHVGEGAHRHVCGMCVISMRAKLIFLRKRSRKKTCYNSISVRARKRSDKRGSEVSSHKTEWLHTLLAVCGRRAMT